MEEWKDVVGFEGIYQVSSLARIKSLERAIAHSSRPGDLSILKERLLKQSLRSGKSPYWSVTMRKDGIQSTGNLHIMVLEAFIGPHPEGTEGCHNDGNPQNNLPSNLRWDSRSGNRLDTVKHGADFQANKTHCPQGHEYTESNTGHSKAKVNRYCKECKKQRSRAQRAAAKLSEES